MTPAIAWQRATRLALLALLLATPAAAQSVLTMGISAAPGSVDPHFNQGTSTQTLTYNVFDTLTERRPDSSLAPGLALAWTPIGPDLWEFRLRPGVRFTDGQPFTADDVAFTVARVPGVPNATSSYAGQVRAIRRVEVVDPLTVRFHTDGPSPSLPIDLSVVAIVSRHAGGGRDDGRLQLAEGRHRHRALHPAHLFGRHGGRAGPQRVLVGTEA